MEFVWHERLAWGAHCDGVHADQAGGEWRMETLDSEVKSSPRSMTDGAIRRGARD